jgi:hypothetical protein
MEEILKYENRDQLYQSLIGDLRLRKVSEEYHPDSFGNFLITLEASNFFIDYINDRSFLTINIRSKLDSLKSIPLTFIKGLIHDPEHIRGGIIADNATRIANLNKFLTENFSKINALYSSENYFNTKKKIEDLLKAQRNKR